MAIVGRILVAAVRGRPGRLPAMVRRICRAILAKAGSEEVSIATTKLQMRRQTATRLP